MQWFDAILLGLIEGITEFLPISSTGHLTITEKLLGYSLEDPAITAFTAVVQIGAISAAVIYFRSDILRVLKAWVGGLVQSELRSKPDYRLGWAIVIGIIPTIIIGLLAKHLIETSLRSLWWVVAGLAVWSFVLWIADSRVSNRLKEQDLNWRHSIAIGLAQAFSLIPGVSRSGSTISAGLLLGYDRVSATRFSFFLGIPVLIAAGLLQAVTKFDDIATHGVGWPQMIAAIIAAFIAGYISIAWLIKYISSHDFRYFIWYRLALAAVIAVLLLTNTISAV